MHRLAENSGLSFMEHELPSDFPDYHNPYPVKWTDDWAVGLVEGRRDYGKPRNVVSGLRNDKLLVAFDIPVYATHSGRTGIEYVTIVARRTDRALRAPAVPSSLYYSEDGRWRIVQKKRSWPYFQYSLVLSPAYIEALWEGLG
ncbi:hypothetical protein SAMN05421770_10312 [Granulicella rosea]|uniref:Uncharacterized protein n=2 Tax=Granulicella rosea TaxID=474952 RepID=A0A239I9V5_9BACT|nr:hypothetical protein SAMN05421770_10312 [Granulicella rosea]